MGYNYHMFNGKPSPAHFNWYEFKYPISIGFRSEVIKDIHIWIKLFGYYL